MQRQLGAGWMFSDREGDTLAEEGERAWTG